MASTPNKTLVYKKVPAQFVVPGEHLSVEDRPINLAEPPPEGGLVVRVLWASLDPHIRTNMRNPSISSYTPALEIDNPVINGTVSRVLASDNDSFKIGELVLAFVPVAEYARVPRKVRPAVRKIYNPFGFELGHFLGALGVPGLTAYSSFYKIGRPKAGETIFISSAAGGVGQVVGQLAKREGLRVIGSVGSAEKLQFITQELGFNGGFVYKDESAREALERLTPGGIDIYFDNVGGHHLEAALSSLKPLGRVIVCGMQGASLSFEINIYASFPQISTYNSLAEQADSDPIHGLVQVVSKQLIIQGFLVANPDFGPAYAKEHQLVVQKAMAEGTFKTKLCVTEGIDSAPQAFVDMLRGANFGKPIVKISDDSNPFAETSSL
ncbi:hypothetical protein S40288_08037 [Stachybotrys chartarum IBT 40288]|nr:hypothetical protein S40288_08037 [Stachybotrys chartarum IBT 40288]